MNKIVRIGMDWAGRVALTGLVLGSLASATLAGPPSFKQIFKKKEAASQAASSLMLTAEHGPWLIMAHTFQGENAEKLAIDLANELRSSYGLRAYIYPKTFDYSETVPGSGIDENGKQKRMVYAQNRPVDCYAVLVGDFASADSPAYDEKLKIVKFARPKTLGGDGSNPGATMKDTWADLKKMITSKSASAKVQPGLMVRAIGTSNPVLPRDFMQPPIVDKFVKNLNSQLQHSLLENPKRFTVRIGTYRGEDTFVIGTTKPMLDGDESNLTGLEKAAETANLAVQLLRNQGFEAYQFHDRNSSIVTIGSFDSIGQSNADGSFAYSAEIQKVINTFGGAKDVKGSQYGQVPTAKSLLDVLSYKKIPELNRGTEKEKMKIVKKYSIPLELTPTVMAVPRPETKSLYSGSLLGKR